MNSEGRVAMLEAAIFDLDGLLIDSEPLWQQAEIEIFGEVGLHMTIDEARQTHGLRCDAVVRHRYGQKPWDLSRHPLAGVEERIVTRVLDLIESRGTAMPGVHHAIEFLESRGLRLAVASSSPMRIIETALEALDLKSRFEVVYSAEREIHGKPDPAVYLSTARELGVSPARCIALEDSLPGLAAARAAGMRCILVPESSIGTAADLSMVDVLLDSLHDLDLGTWSDLNA